MHTTLKLCLLNCISFYYFQLAKKIANDFVFLLVFLSLTFNPILAYGFKNVDKVPHIVPDGTTETLVDRAQNGTPVVNIARPTQGGVSVNKFRDYNVFEDNAILNNHKGDPDRSLLGGILYGNPNFDKENGRQANIILNEVTSNRVSKLSGYTEIFGQRAALIIANPNGIQTSGAGFINTSQLSLITGVSNINKDSGEIEYFDIDPNAQILIEARNIDDGNGGFIPLGLDASTTDYAEIISRTVKISGEIYGGKELHIKAGNDQYNYQTKQISSSTDNLSESKPEIAIDATAFGGMYADTIKFTSTEAGLGVRSVGGELQTSLDDIVINSQGIVEFDDLSAKRDVKIIAENDIINHGSIVSLRDASLDSQKNITFDQNAFISANNNIVLEATNNINFNKKNNVIANNNINIIANYLDNQDSVIASQGFFDIEVDYLNNKNGIIRSSLSQMNEKTENIITITGSNNIFSNYQNPNPPTANFNNEDGAIIVDGNLYIEALAKLTNLSVIKAANNLKISALEINNKDTANQKYLVAKADDTTNKDAVYLSKGLSAGNHLELITDSLINDNGYLNSDKDLTVDVTNNNNLDLKGFIFASNNLNINANAINNYSKLGKELQNITINAKGDFSNKANGEIAPENNLKISSNNFLNYGVISSANILKIIAEGNIVNGDSITKSINSTDNNSLIPVIAGGVGDNKIISQNGFIKNYGKISGANNLTIEANKKISDNSDYNSDNFGISNYGQIAAGNNLKLDSQSFIINKGDNQISQIIDQYKPISQQDISTIQNNNPNLEIKNIDEFFNDNKLIEGYESGLPDYIRLYVNDNVRYIKVSDMPNFSDEIVKINSALNSGSSLIFALNNMDLMANDYIRNDYAQIWAGKNIQMQKSTASLYDIISNPDLEVTDDLLTSAKNNAVINKAGSIQSYDGDIMILTSDFSNVKGDEALTIYDREIMEFVHKDTSDDNSDIRYIHYDQNNNLMMSYEGEVHSGHTDGGNYFEHLGYHARLNLNRGRLNDGYRIKIGGLTWSDHRAGIDRKTKLYKENTNLVKSLIKADKNLYIYADNITNDVSEIVSGSDMTLVGDQLFNKSRDISSEISYRCHAGSEWCQIEGVQNLSSRDFNFKFNKTTGTINSKIIAGGKLKGNFVNKIDNKSILQDQGKINIISKGIESQFYDSTAADYDVYNGTLTLPRGRFGLFKRANLDSKYLYESNIDFLDLNRFIGSNYFLRRLGINPNDLDIRRIGDAFFEQKQIMDHINNLNNHSYLQDDIVSANQQMQILFDNAVDLTLEDSTLEIGKELTVDQIKNLKRDILWLVEEEVDGNKVLVTKLYLANETKENIAKNQTSGSLIQGESVSLVANEINGDNSTIKSSGDDIDLKAKDINLANSIILSALNANIDASNNVVLANDIKFSDAISGKYQSNNSNSQYAAQSLKDDAQNIRDSITYNAGSDIKITGNNVTIANNQINSQGSVFINADNDINNSNYTIKSSLNTILTAGNDINNISTVNDGNISRIEANQMVALEAGNNINNKGGVIKAGEFAYLKAGGDVNNENLMQDNKVIAKGIIESDQKLVIIANNDINNNGGIMKSGSDMLLEANRDINNLAISQDFNMISEAKIESGGNSSITSGRNINNLASTIKSGGQLDITAGNDINNLALSKTKTLDTLIDSKRIKINNDDYIESKIVGVGNIESSGNISMKAGNDINNVASNIKTTGENQDFDGSIAMKANRNINIINESLRNRQVKRWDDGDVSGTEIRDNITNISSNINSRSDLILDSGLDTNIIGSNVNVGNNLISDSTGALNIKSVQDQSYYHHHNNRDGDHTTITKTSTTNVGSVVTASGNINSRADNGINIIASKVTSKGDINLNSNKEINILSDQDEHFSKVTSNKSGLTTTQSSIDIAYDLINVHSNLDASKDLKINSGTNINLIGANLKAGNDIDIDAKNEIIIAAVADERYRYSYSVKTRSMAKIAKYTGISAALKTLQFASDSLSFVTQPFTDLGLNALAPVISGSVDYMQNLAEGDFSSKEVIDIKNTKNYQLAKINAVNNINISSGDSLNLIGVDIDTNDIALSSSKGDINIMNVKDSNYSKSESRKSHMTLNSFVTDLIKMPLLALSTSVTSINPFQHPETKQQKVENNRIAMGQASKKQSTQIFSKTDETIISSSIDSNNFTINSGRDTMIISSNINTTDNLDLNSIGDILITSDFENDSTFALIEKKNPNIIAAFSSGLVRLIGDSMPDFSFEKPSQNSQNQAKQRENDSLGHNPHSRHISVATKTDNAIINGYTISNNDANEFYYDTDLDKKTIESKSYISSNLISQNNININSDNGNNSLISANLIAGNDININSNSGQTLINSSANEIFTAISEVKQEYNDVSADYNQGKFSVSARSSIYEKDSKNTTKTQLATNISSGSNININAKDDISILSSNLNSGKEINLNSSEGDVIIGVNKNTQNNEIEIREGTLELSVGVGHAAVDALYAVNDTVKAAENLKKAKENLSNMKRLYSQGKATKDAVDDAKTNLAIATLNVTLAYLKAASAAEKAAKSSYTAGFYADAQLTRSGDKTNINSNSSQEIESNLLANSDININSGSSLILGSESQKGNTFIKGNLQSVNSDINITSFNETNIEAIKNESYYSSKTEGFTTSTSIGASYGNSTTQDLINSITAQISKRSSKSDNSDINYTNSNILANNGAININSINNNTNIIGANLKAENIVINSGNDLNIVSLQNSSKSKSKSKSFGFGGGAGGSVSLNYSSNKSNFKRDWVDDQTDIIAQNNLIINTKNNTDIKGALIASNNDNLLINTGTLTYSDIIDTEQQESSGFGIATNISVGEDSKNPDTQNPNQDKNYYPNGSTTLSINNQGYRREQITRATIGNGIININDKENQTQDLANLNRDISKSQEITKDTITGALNISATIDNRLIAAAFGSKGAQKSLVNTIKHSPENLANALEQNALLIDLASETLGEVPFVGGITRNVITSIPEGIVDYFYEDDSRVYDRNGNIVSVTSAANYLVNGVMNDKDGVLNTLNQKDVDAVVRYNPTSGLLGDLIESGLGKTLGRVLPGTNKVATLVAGDLYERKDLKQVNNVFHSQGSIIGDNAMRYYKNVYNVNGSGKINKTQKFVAVGPAVGENIWHNTSRINIDRKKNKSSLYVLDPRDPVAFLTSPRNLLNDVTNPIQQKLFGSQNNLPYILSNPVDIAKGIYNGIRSPSAHIMTNKLYLEYLKNNNSNANSQNNNP